MIKRVFPYYKTTLWAAGAAVAALVMAFIAEYGFGLAPCPLCVYQRIPYALVILCAALSIISKGQYDKAFMYVIIGLFLTDAAIAFYHSGVEWGVFEGLQGCSGTADAPKTVEDAYQQLMTTGDTPRCDTPAFTFLTLSMAGWNMIYGLGVAVILLLSMYRDRRL